MENSMKVHLKTKNTTTIWSSNPNPVHISGERCSLKAPNVHWSTIHNSKYTEATKLSINRGMDKKIQHTCTHTPFEGRNGNTLKYSCLKNSLDREAWQATFHRAAKSQTWLNTCTHTKTYTHTHTHKHTYTQYNNTKP